MFCHFLDECSAGFVRTIFREWYSIAVIRKKVWSDELTPCAESALI